MIVKTLQDLKKAVSNLQGSDVIGYDLETTGLSPQSDKTLIIAIGNREVTYAIDVQAIGELLSYREIKPLLTGDSLVIIHNAVFDYKFTYHNKVKIKNIHCTLVTENLLTAGKVVDARADLKSVAARYANVSLDKSVRKDFTNGVALMDYHFEYAANDVKYLFDIYDQQIKKVRHYKLDRVYNLEMGLLPVTSLMEYTGIGIEADLLRSYIPFFENYIERADRALQDLFIANGGCDQILITKAGYKGINLQSRNQVIQALNKVGVDLDTLNAKEVLKWDIINSKNLSEEDYRITGDTEVDDAIEHYEGLSNKYLRSLAFTSAARKLLSVYVLGTLDKVNPVTGRVHGWFKQVGARETGRYSSDLQQIPNDIKLKRLSIPYSIRGCLVASSGRVFLNADYQAIELVILADLSKDQKLGHEIVNGDVHLVVVREALASLTPLALQITPENKGEEPFKTLRQAAKRVSYATAYGVTGGSLAEQLSMDLSSLSIKVNKEQGEKILQDWKEIAFPEAGSFLKKSSEQAVTKGYTTSALGRRRWYDLEFAAQNKWKLYAYMRQGSNQPIQSTSADITKLAMLKIYQNMDYSKARIVLSVHDELLIESVQSYADTAAEIMKKSMEGSAQEILTTMGKYVIVDVEQSGRYSK
jgi:DNA polymerase I-like protein with 3'-5' exonuclease and polymerase domains